MDWKKLFDTEILRRGYDYYLDKAVENLDISADNVSAEVIGTEEYDVEIFLDGEEIIEMDCSCPYADSGRNCKHMAAVLYEWTEAKKQKNEGKKKNDEDAALFIKARTVEAHERKTEAVQRLVENADISIVRSYLVSILMENDKLLLRFHNMVKKTSTKKDIKRYIKQIDDIARRYLGRDRFINYRMAGSFISELGEILEEDVRRMMDDREYVSAFQVMNHMFVLIGDVDMDDSDGGTGMLAERIYELWSELLTKVGPDEKREMFRWFTGHLDGSVIDYLEEYIEQIIMAGFEEQEYLQQRFTFVEEKIKAAEAKDSDWSVNYHVGKWAVTYLSLLESQGSKEQEKEEFCRKYWKNSSVRKYYIDMCVQAKEYDKALKALDESMVLDKEYRGLVVDYNKKKKEIYLLQGNKEAYVEQLWELLFCYNVGDLDIYRELKRQYTKEEWMERREEVFEKLPRHARVDRLFQEEKLYDRLLDSVLESQGIYILQQYTEVLKNDYPEQLLQKYRKEVNEMASYARERKKYREVVQVLRSMKEIEGGPEVVEAIVAGWKSQYRNRPAMMDELKKL